MPALVLDVFGFFGQRCPECLCCFGMSWDVQSWPATSPKIGRSPKRTSSKTCSPEKDSRIPVPSTKIGKNGEDGFESFRVWKISPFNSQHGSGWHHPFFSGWLHGEYKDMLGGWDTLRKGWSRDCVWQLFFKHTSAFCLPCSQCGFCPYIGAFAVHVSYHLTALGYARACRKKIHPTKTTRNNKKNKLTPCLLAQSSNFPFRERQLSQKFLSLPEMFLQLRRTSKEIIFVWFGVKWFELV